MAHEYYEYERWYVSGSYIARTVCARMSTASTAGGTCEHHIARGLHECNEYRQYELLTCVSNVQHEGA